MSHQVAVVAMAVHTAMGDLDTTWQELCAGKSAIAPLQRFDTTNYLTNLAALLPQNSDVSPSHSITLLEHLATDLGVVPSNTMLFGATTKWGIDQLERAGRQLPYDANALYSATLIEQMRRLWPSKGAGEVFAAACASSTLALARASATIAAGRSSSVLVCGVDMCSEFVFSGFSALQGLAPEACRPFCQQRRGLTLGEGAAALLLMDAKRARAEGRPILATIAGWGTASDAHHITAPARDGCGLQLACRKALAKAACDVSDIDAIHAHGTGTVYNDAMEITAFRQLFPESLPLIFGVKGAIGHTLGAAGAIETALSIQCFQNNTLPLTVGVETPMTEAANAITRQTTPFTGTTILKTNSGFGGINAALLFKKSEVVHVR